MMLKGSDHHLAADELAEMDDVCAAVEKCIAARDTAAVVELNTQFHELIAKASRNRWIREFLASIKAQTRRLYRTSLERTERAVESAAEHRLVLRALRVGNAERAEALGRQHILRAREAAIAAGASGGRPKEF